MKFLVRLHTLLLVLGLDLSGTLLMAQCTANVGGAIVGCEGSTISLLVQASGGQEPYTFGWSPSTGLSDVNVPDPELLISSGSTAYTVTVTDAAGCTSLGEVVVTGHTMQQAQFTMEPATLLCPGEPVLFSEFNGSATGLQEPATKRIWTIVGGAHTILSGEAGSMNGEPGDPDEWSTGSSELSVAFTGPGTAEVLLTLASSCGTTSSSSLLSVGNVPAPPTVATNSPLCIGQTLTLSAVAQAGVTYQWSGPAGNISGQASITIPNASASHTGSWSVAASAGGCSGPASILEVEVHMPPSISITPSYTAFCAGDSATLSVAGAQGYTWYNGGAIVGAGAELDVAPGSTTTYTVSGMANGCAGYASATVQVYPMPQASFTHAPAACVEQELAIGNTSTGYSALAWSFGDGATSTADSPDHVYSSEGTWPVMLVASTAAGCTDTATSFIAVWDMPTAQIAADINSGCAPLAVQFSSTLSGPGLGLAWDFGNGMVSSEIGPGHLFTADGDHTVSLVVSNAGGCSASASLPVTVYPVPQALFTLPSTHSCAVPVTIQPTNLSAGGTSYSWVLGNGSTADGPSPSATFIEPGTHAIVLTVGNDQGCEDHWTESFTVNTGTMAQFTFTPAALCAGEEVVFSSTAEHAEQHFWFLGDGAMSSEVLLQHTYAEAGSYDVMLVVVGAGGCSDSLMVPGAVTVFPVPEADFTWEASGSMQNAVQFIDASTGADSFNWELGPVSSSMERHPMVLYPADGGSWEVCLTVGNNAGCEDVACERISLASAPQVFAPNAFTPDGDGINDIFLPVLSGYGSWNFNLLVFDRWGELVFEGRDGAAGWDGTTQAGVAPMGVYVWRMEVPGIGRMDDHTGHVTLLR